jgi:DNA-binding NarL/FixJ family response regulator/class 3 adenylate cyclase
MTGGVAGGSGRTVMTVVFTDIVESTSTVARLGDAEWRNVLDGHDAMLRAELRRYQGNEVTTTGDGMCAVFDSPGAALRFGRTVAKEAPTLGIHLRVGIHTGECEFRGRDLHGIAVHIASRVRDLAYADEVLVTSTVQALLAGSGFGFADRGDHELRGVPGLWGLRTVTSTPSPVPLPPPRTHDGSAPSDAAPRVVVVDDHPLWRETLRGLVDRSRAAHVVGEASDGAEAVRVATDARADVVLMDMYLPTMTGAESTAALRTAAPTAKVIMLSSADDRASVLAAVHAGASGYLLKTAAAEDVLDAIRRVHRGEMVFPPQLTDIVLAALRRDAAETEGSGQDDDDLAAFTRRERDVLALIAEGRTNQAISERLHLSTKSVEAYVARIFAKLGLEPTAHDHRRVLAAVAYLRATGG